MNKISDMQVGKLYKLKNIDHIFECLLVDSGQACMKNTINNKISIATTHYVWSEYIVPKTIT